MRPVVGLPILTLLLVAAGCIGETRQAMYPITEARGRYTIRVGFYRSWPRKGIDGLEEANKAAIALRRAGHEAYVTDMITQAIVTVGTFDDKDDPRLKATWKGFYEEWQRKAGHTTLGQAQKELEKWYGEDTPFGSRPWPVAIISQQRKMKKALGTWTAADEQRYQDYLEALRKERRPQ